MVHGLAVSFAFSKIVEGPHLRSGAFRAAIGTVHVCLGCCNMKCTVIEFYLDFSCVEHNIVVNKAHYDSAQIGHA